jgi:hypothetical protein
VSGCTNNVPDEKKPTTTKSIRSVKNIFKTFVLLLSWPRELSRWRDRDGANERISVLLLLVETNT